MNARRGQPFSLIELLVVIGVIALLASLLLPALGKAKDSAQTMACASNMHQTQVAAACYASDNNGYFRGEQLYANAVASGIWNSYVPEAPSVGVGILLKLGYLGSPDCLWCPLDSSNNSYWNPPLSLAKAQFGMDNKALYCSYALDTFLMQRGYDSSYPYNYRLDKLPPEFPFAADMLLQTNANSFSIPINVWTAHKTQNLNVSYNDGAITRFNLKSLAVDEYAWGTAFTNTTTWATWLLWRRFQDNHGRGQ